MLGEEDQDGTPFFACKAHVYTDLQLSYLGSQREKYRHILMNFHFYKAMENFLEGL